MYSFAACLVCLAAFAADKNPTPKTPTATERERFFETRVRPILAGHCIECHGGKKQEGGLRLDSKSALIAGAESGKVVVAGKPDRSRLVEVIQYSDLDVQMPPDGKLRPQDIAALSQWIKLGIPWPKSATIAQAIKDASADTHWAFQPIRAGRVPGVLNSAAAQTPIDRFVLAKLEEKKLGFSSPAGRRSLIRRATFDLLGLPPTPEEIAAFESGDSPDAFTQVIDRLLASPRYGERWGRHWLDVARYADNKGYVFFEEKKFPWASPYRDFVIRSFNDDLPYDKFVRYQLAADQIVNDREDRRPLAAMGFLTLGARFMNNQHDMLDDRIDVVTRGLLGLTVTCSRCHDHKFDPITQKDYYALYGVFRSSYEPMLPPLFTTPPKTEEYQKFDEQMQTRVAKMQQFVNKKHGELVSDGRNRAVEYLIAVHARRNQPNTEDFMLLVPAGELNPTMILRWQVYLQSTRKTRNPVWTIWHAFSDLADDEFSQRSAAVLARFKSQPNDDRPVNRLVHEAFAGKPPASMKDVAARYGKLFAAMDGRWQQILKSSENKGQATLKGFSDPAERELQQVFYGRQAPPNISKVLGWGFLSLLPDRPAQGEFKKLLKAVEEWSMKGPGAPPRAMVLVDAKRPYDPRVFRRGNPNRPGEPIARRFPKLLNNTGKPFERGSGRLELANAIVDAGNPLTARVIVNRIWLNHFGRGLVITPSDFGLRSEPPTHPKLLDYLAADFVRQGWSIKRLHRQIMLSAVYQQVSNDRPQPARVDPENRLLWKMNRRRLDFESMRDSLLAVSGTLDETLYGPPVNLLSGYVARRTVYGFVNRMDLPGLLRSFDFPSPAATSPQRTSTTVPPQALYLMNNQFVAETVGRVLGRPDVAGLSEMQPRVNRLYDLLFGHRPTPAEFSLAREFLGDKPTPDSWKQYVHGLLMTNEFVFVD